MKRLTAFALVLILLLSLAACGSSESGPALQDKLGTTYTVSTDPSEAEEPTGGAPVSDDYSKYAGIYVCDTSWSEYPTVLEIHVYGDILLLEYSYLSDGVLFGTWVEEFWPDPDIFEDGELENVCGMYQGFNILDETAAYWSVATPCTIVLTEDGVCVQEKGTMYEYRRDESLPSVHTSFDSQMASLHDRVSGQPAAELAGEWEYSNETWSTYLHLGEDGAFTYVYKELNRPVEVLEGAWVLDSSTDYLAVQAERIGAETMPYALELSCSEEDDGLCLMSIGFMYSDISLYYSLFYRPAEGPWRTGFTLSQLSSGITTLWTDSGSVTDSNSYDECYYYRIPLFLAEDSSAVDQINNEIYDRFERLAQQQLAFAAENTNPPIRMIDYYATVYSGLEQLVVWTDSNYVLPDCAVYCYDREQDTQLDTRAVLKRLGISEEDFLEAVRVAAEAYFMEMYGSWTGEQWQDMGCDKALAWTLSDEAVNLQLPVLVNGFGDLAVIARIGCTGDVDYCLAVLYPFSEAVG